MPHLSDGPSSPDDYISCKFPSVLNDLAKGVHPISTYSASKPSTPKKHLSSNIRQEINLKKSFLASYVSQKELVRTRNASSKD